MNSEENPHERHIGLPIVPKGVAHITLATTDVARARHFFVQTLGWRPIDRPGNIGIVAAWLEIAPGQELHLLQIPDCVPSPFEREFGRHIAINFPVAEFGELKARLVAHGAELIAALRPTPFERFFFRNPDGYVFEIIAAERPSET